MALSFVLLHYLSAVYALFVVSPATPTQSASTENISVFFALMEALFAHVSEVIL